MITTNGANGVPRGRHVKNLSEDTLKTLPEDDSASVFDLGENYQSAVDCLIQCESIIKGLQTRLAAKDEELVAKDELITSLEKRLSEEPASSGEDGNENALREELAAKDERIASLETHAAGLEGKLIEMSLELASLKADHDRQINGLKRRVSGIENDEEAVGIEPTAPPRRQSSWQPSGEGKGNADCRASAASMITQREESSSRRRRNPRHRHTLSRSWSGIGEAPTSWTGIDTSAWPSKQVASFNSFSEHPQEGESKRSDDPPAAPGVKQGGGRLSTFARRMSGGVASPDGRDGAALDDSGKASEDSAGSLCHDWPHNSSQTSRRLSNIGQFILNKAIFTDRPTHAKAPIANDGDGRSAPSQPDRLSHVIFPVSSDDCLVGLCQDSRTGERGARVEAEFENGSIDW